MGAQSAFVHKTSKGLFSGNQNGKYGVFVCIEDFYSILVISSEWVCKKNWERKEMLHQSKLKNPLSQIRLCNMKTERGKGR